MLWRTETLHCFEFDGDLLHRGLRAQFQTQAEICLIDQSVGVHIVPFHGVSHRLNSQHNHAILKNPDCAG
jgi:hypothetical protein